MHSDLFGKTSSDMVCNLLNHFRDFPRGFQLAIQNHIIRHINQFFDHPPTIHRGIWEYMLDGQSFRVVANDVKADIGTERDILTAELSSEPYTKFLKYLDTPTYDQDSFREFFFKPLVADVKSQDKEREFCWLPITNLVAFKLRGMALYNNFVFSEVQGDAEVFSYAESLWGVIGLIFDQSATHDDVRNAAIFTFLFAGAFDMDKSIVADLIYSLSDPTSEEQMALYRDTLQSCPKMTFDEIIDRFVPTELTRRVEDINFGNKSFCLYKVCPSENIEKLCEIDRGDVSVYGDNLSLDHYDNSVGAFVDAVLSIVADVEDLQGKSYELTTVNHKAPIPLCTDLTTDLDMMGLAILGDTYGVKTCSVSTKKAIYTVFEYCGKLYLATQPNDVKFKNCIVGITLEVKNGYRNFIGINGDPDTVYKYSYQSGGEA